MTASLARSSSTPEDPGGPRGAAALASWQRDLMAIAEALFCREQGPPPATRLVWLADEMADFLMRSGLRTRLVLRGSVAAIARAAPPLVGSVRPFRALPLESRIKALERLEKSPLGLACFAVKALSCIIWYEHPDSAEEIGFDGACHALKGTPDE